MATIAEQVGQRAATQGEQFGRGLNEVMGVANFVQRTKENRQNVERQKEEMEMKKATLAVNSLNSALRFKGPNRKRALNSVKSSLSQVFPNLNTDTIDAMGEDEASLEALKALAPLVSQGVATPEQAGRVAEFMQGDMMSSMQMLQAIGAEQEMTKRAALSSGFKEKKFESQQVTKFRTEKEKIIKDVQRSSIKFNDTLVKMKDAKANLKLALDTNNVTAYNQAVTSLISVNQSRISDADFRLFSSELGLGKLEPFLQKATGNVPTKTANNAIAVLDVISKARSTVGPKIQQNFRSRAENLSKFPGAPERMEEIERSLNLGQFAPGKEAPELPPGLSAAVPKLKEGYAALPPEKQPLMLQQLSTRFKLPVEQIKQILGVK